MHAINFEDLQQELCRIPDVRAANVIGTEEPAHVTGVYILSEGARTPKQIVRDVQAYTKTKFNLEIDYRCVSIVSLLDEGRKQADESGRISIGRGDRITIGGIEVDEHERSIAVRVTLDSKKTGSQAVGIIESGQLTREYMVAQATVEALRKLQPRFSRAAVEEATIVQAKVRSFALVSVLVLGSRGEEIVGGCAILRDESDMAVVRATLDAVNRRLRR